MLKRRNLSIKEGIVKMQHLYLYGNLFVSLVRMCRATWLSPPTPYLCIPDKVSSIVVRIYGSYCPVASADDRRTTSRKFGILN